MVNGVGTASRQEGDHHQRIVGAAKATTATTPVMMMHRRKGGHPPPYFQPCLQPLRTTERRSELQRCSASPAWRREKSYSPTEESLTMEIQEFVSYVALNAGEKLRREELIATVRRVVTELWGSVAHVFVYGSYALDLSIPSSDVDLTVLFDDDDKPAASVAYNDDAMEVQTQHMRLRHQLAQRLTAMGFRVNVYDFCRVPVVHFVDSFTGLSCDINVSEIKAVQQVVSRQREWLSSCAEARELILITKAALKQWGLNSLFHGGLSATALYMLVRRFLEEDVGHETTASPACHLTARRLLNFWRYASSDVFLNGYGVHDAFAADTDAPSGEAPPAAHSGTALVRGKADLSSGSFRLPDLLALFRHSALLLDAMTRDSLVKFGSGGLGAIFTDPRRDASVSASMTAAPAWVGVDNSFPSTHPSLR
ncbi:DNA primase small subunit [Trypanosoma rangeli]|uniref:DNA primase small subunit n=1 Tax=Trypanosoma rangeli TaxID=5698 RepID=A0A3R7M5P4_TRYRA|nr:DNA primase small subunit [Trypanosoma rangeli]RNF09524.1 DNA primase small subunit [Trypanosoma rangeli]|eukprot:RNF09524.1 DNA primase small subunit [Trypanosoma rangeli]